MKKIYYAISILILCFQNSVYASNGIFLKDNKIELNPIIDNYFIDYISSDIQLHFIENKINKYDSLNFIIDFGLRNVEEKDYNSFSLALDMLKNISNSNSFSSCQFENGILISTNAYYIELNKLVFSIVFKNQYKESVLNFVKCLFNSQDLIKDKFEEIKTDSYNNLREIEIGASTYAQNENIYKESIRLGFKKDLFPTLNNSSKDFLLVKDISVSKMLHKILKNNFIDILLFSNDKNYYVEYFKNNLSIDFIPKVKYELLYNLKDFRQSDKINIKFVENRIMSTNIILKEHFYIENELKKNCDLSYFNSLRGLYADIIFNDFRRNLKISYSPSSNKRFFYMGIKDGFYSFSVYTESAKENLILAINALNNNWNNFIKIKTHKDDFINEVERQMNNDLLIEYDNDFIVGEAINAIAGGEFLQLNLKMRITNYLSLNSVEKFNNFKKCISKFDRNKNIVVMGPLDEKTINIFKKNKLYNVTVDRIE